MASSGIWIFCGKIMKKTKSNLCRYNKYHKSKIHFTFFRKSEIHKNCQIHRNYQIRKNCQIHRNSPKLQNSQKSPKSPKLQNYRIRKKFAQTPQIHTNSPTSQNSLKSQKLPNSSKFAQPPKFTKITKIHHTCWRHLVYKTVMKWIKILPNFSHSVLK